MMAPGTDTEDMRARIERFGLNQHGFSYQGYPVTFWDIYGEKGIPLRTTVSEIGPLLMARILKLNELQSNILAIVYKIADDNGLLLIDLKDLKSMLNYVNDNRKEFEAEYGKMSPASMAAILRAVVALEIEGGEVFFGEPGLNIRDWIAQEGGKGMINILDSESLINNGRLYSTFLLWMLSELFELLPEVGDLSKPKMVFFFDEAHLLFNDAPKPLLEKIEQVVKLIRSKGVGVYFCTQNPRDIPDDVLAQLSNRIQHALHAYTPADQKAVRAAADSFRVNPAFNTFDTILGLGTGEAVVSFLQEDGTPGIAQKTRILPPQSRMGAVSDFERDQKIKESILYGKYADSVDPESAYELLLRIGLEKEAAEAKAKQELEAAKQKAKEEAELAKQQAKEAREAAREAEKNANAKKRAAKTIGSTVAGTVGREVGKTVGGTIGGKFGKTIGGNLGSSLGRGILNTLFGG
jgi:DNA helicase HerA-like ATPase